MTLEHVVAGLVEKTERRFYGKYRGFVVDNEDPALLGRLRLSVPSVLGLDTPTGWATPCVPYGGAANQGFLFIPERDARVWVEFEEGHPDFPIWAGAYFVKPEGESQLPKPQADDGNEESAIQNPATRKIIKTLKGHTVQFEDADDKEAILVREGRQGHLITMNKDGIKIIDKKRNTVMLSENGIKITDAKGNSVEMSDSAMTLTAKVPFKIDASGQPVTIVAAAIDLKKG